MTSKKTDAGWMAHIYLVPNYFYFPNLTELALVGPPPLRLSEPRAVSSNNPFYTFLTFWRSTRRLCKSGGGGERSTSAATRG